MAYSPVQRISWAGSVHGERVCAKLRPIDASMRLDGGPEHVFQEPVSNSRESLSIVRRSERPGRGYFRGGGRLFLIFLIVSLAGLISVIAVGPDASWTRDLPKYAYSENGEKWARTAIHVHSVYSHDACDHRPQTKGAINEACLADLRQAICRNHIDVLFLTEHQDHLVTTSELSSILNLKRDDTPIQEHGQIVGSIQHCPDGHTAHIYPGTESYISAIGLTKHPQADASALRRFYSAYHREEVADLRRDGALIVVQHAERGNVSLPRLREIQPDLMEVYNLHANFTAMARRPGTSSLVTLTAQMLQFLINPYLEPDLLFLALFREDEIALTKWSQITAETHVTGIAAVDAHQNVPVLRMRDGERVDGYRRSMRSISNFVEVDGRFDRASILAALKAGKVFIVFESFGTPQELQYQAVSDGRTYGMGETVASSEGGQVHLFLKCPEIVGVQASLLPERNLVILRATADGWKEVARSRDADLHYMTTEAGTYRGEVRIRPTHLARYLFGAGKLIRDVPWIYANPIYVR
jgi:hypothetical protein